ncbi:Rv1355c family protein [Dyadobacter arcticus]|uniref:Molybdopterin/thiamine biosynthesis adenylyltransferase/nitroreductase n=1 Tax=Dyadobacter arcticus TaxID=1078754 RepID=A0ABX0UJ49_9BACT|nr:Rv1355c family protein [Dyadobacter arcticus]NIJ53033.1 molybdopterin/thiamine biosynthesis adenylyltransferase/nitroreductase [Dyadobacter arcticus]
MYQEASSNAIYKPVFIPKEQYADKEKFDLFIENYQDKTILDVFASQKKELIRLRSPKKRLSAIETDALYDQWLAEREQETEGLWILYPWSGRLIHIVDKDEFVELRTSRNQYKITPQEQRDLARRKIGIIGLSVGHAVAVSIATERICGILKLADFDTIELSNLNRIKTGLHNIGVNKCIVTAREIAEIDPFLEIECYTEGISKTNMSRFLLEGGKLDILIDECDDIGVKIACRVMAASHQIPVVMETSDRGMLDVERFDIEQDRPIFHGLLKGIPAEKFDHISDEERLPLVLRIVNAINGSKRGKVSLVEIGQTISTWPQLASAVTLGAGVVTDVCRRILLKQYQESGRYYIDLEELVGNKSPVTPAPLFQNPYLPFDPKEAVNEADSLPYASGQILVSDDMIRELVYAACYAPSTGNDQPWKWLYRNGRLHLFHDRYRSYSFGDFDHIASNISFGAAYENLILKSHESGLGIKSQLFPLGPDSTLIAAINFNAGQSLAVCEPVYAPDSVGYIFERCTNRNPSFPARITSNEMDALKNAAESIEGARFHYFDDKLQMSALGEIIGECDRIRLLNPNGHHDFVQREMKWSPLEAESSKDGIDIRTLGMNSAQMAALAIIRDGEITKTLKSINGGSALIDVAMKTVATASALGMITLPKYDHKNFFLGGMSMQRLWLQAEQAGFAIHPLISPFYLFPRITKGDGAGLDADESAKLKDVRKKFRELVPFEDNIAEVFLFKIAKAEKPQIKSYRLPLEETLFIVNPEN